MSKELIKKMESQIPGWEKLSASHVSEGGRTQTPYRTPVTQ